MVRININKTRLKQIMITILISLLLFQFIMPIVMADDSNQIETDIESVVNKTLEKSGASKISVGCFKDNDVKYYGQSSNYLYQIGFTSKEFVSLGILSLIESEMISLEDSIEEYIEDFQPKYQGERCTITVENLLTQSSGIDSSKIKYPDQEELSGLPRRLSQSLIFRPGYQVKESDYNYSLMALIIENVSGYSYTDYMKNFLLDSLLLHDTYTYRPKNDNVINGKRLGYGKTINFNFGYSDSQEPTCYMYSTPKDMVTWMRELCGDVYLNDSMTTVLNQYKLLVDLNESCSTWSHKQDSYRLYSCLPNYSSALIMSYDADIGVCVMADCNIGQTIENLAQQIYDILTDKNPGPVVLDNMIKLDIVFIIITILVFCVIVYFIYKASKNKSKDNMGAVFVFEVLLITITVAMSIYVPTQAKIGWYDLVMTWAPFSVVIGMVFLVLACIFGLILSLILND